MNQSDNEEYEKKNEELFDNSDDCLNIEDDLFKFKGRANKRDQINDDYRGIFEDIDEDDFQLRDDPQDEFHNFDIKNQSRTKLWIPSLNSINDIHEQMNDSIGGTNHTRDQNKSVMALSDPSTNEKDETENEEILEKVNTLYVKADWNFVYDQLKTKGYSLRKINDEIGSNFRNNLYSGRSMRIFSFNQLRRIIDSEIDYEIVDIHPKYEKFIFSKDKNLAEMFGVLLGDGHISKNDQQVKISLNPVKEAEYVEYVSDLFEKTLQIKPSRYYPPGSDEDIKLYSGRKGISKELQNLGLISGDKVENQIDVPNWIKENADYKISCIRGLFDTDGSTYFQKRKQLGIKYIQNKFSNKSIPLLDFFEQFCTENNIKISRTGDDVLIQSRKGVTDFYDIVKPLKMARFLKNNKLKREDLGRSILINE